MPVKIYAEDTAPEIAKKIWEHFELFDSISVYGWVTKEEKLIPKGDCVIDNIKELYEMEFTRLDKNKKKIRILIYPENSVGGPIAHKIFRFDKKFVDKEPRVTIWRIQ